MPDVDMLQGAAEPLLLSWAPVCLEETAPINEDALVFANAPSGVTNQDLAAERADESPELLACRIWMFGCGPAIRDCNHAEVRLAIRT